MSNLVFAAGSLLSCSFLAVSSAESPELRVNFSKGAVIDLIPDSEHTILNTHAEISCQDASDVLAGSERRADLAKEAFMSLLSKAKQRILSQFPEIDGGSKISYSDVKNALSGPELSLLHECANIYCSERSEDTSSFLFECAKMCKGSRVSSDHRLLFDVLEEAVKRKITEDIARDGQSPSALDLYDDMYARGFNIHYESDEQELKRREQEYQHERERERAREQERDREREHKRAMAEHERAMAERAEREREREREHERAMR